MSHLDYPVNINGHTWIVVDKNATNGETYRIKDVIENGGRKPTQVMASSDDY